MELMGSEWLVKALHIVSQGLLVPVIAGLLIFFMYALVELGALLAEFRSMKRVSSDYMGDFLASLRNSGDLRRTVHASELCKEQKDALERFLALEYLAPLSRRAYARRIVEETELRRMRLVERTDIIARLGPALGLMGTLIPLGPGLAALSAGEVQGLAQAVIIAFDTTVVGLAAGGIAFFISRVRRRWYGDYLSTLEAAMEGLLEVLDAEENEKVVASWRG